MLTKPYSFLFWSPILYLLIGLLVTFRYYKWLLHEFYNCGKLYQFISYKKPTTLNFIYIYH